MALCQFLPGPASSFGLVLIAFSMLVPWRLTPWLIVVFGALAETLLAAAHM